MHVDHSVLWNTFVHQTVLMVGIHHWLSGSYATLTDVSVDLLFVMDGRIWFSDETLTHHLLLLHIEVVQIDIVLGGLVRRLMSEVALIVGKGWVSHIVSSLHVEDLPIDTSTVVMVVHWAKVRLVWGPLRTLACSIRCQWSLSFLLLLGMILVLGRQNWGISVSSHYAWRNVMRNLNLTSTMTALDNLLICPVWPLDISDLSRGFSTLLPDPLDRWDNLLVLLLVVPSLERILLTAFALVDLQLQHPFIGAIPATIGASANAPVSFVVYAWFTLAACTNVTGVAFAWINASGVHWVLSSDLVTNFELLKAIIQIWALSILIHWTHLVDVQLFAAIGWRVAVWAVASSEIVTVFLLHATHLLLLNLRMEVPEMDVVLVVHHHVLLAQWHLHLLLLFHQLLDLGPWLLQLGLVDLQVSVDPGDLAVLVVQNVLELLLKLLLCILVLFLGCLLYFLSFFVKLLDLLIKHLNMEL